MINALDLVHELENSMAYELVNSNDVHIHMARMDVIRTRIKIRLKAIGQFIV